MDKDNKDLGRYGADAPPLCRPSGEAAEEASSAKPAAANAGAFTPGPWTYVPLKGWRRFSVLGPDRHEWNNRRQSICHVGISYHAHREANARLIAAAPDLYEALEALLEAAERHVFGDECLPQRRAARAALNKALGK